MLPALCFVKEFDCRVIEVNEADGGIHVRNIQVFLFHCQHSDRLYDIINKKAKVVMK